MSRAKILFWATVSLVLLMSSKGYGETQEHMRVYMNPSISSAPIIIAQEEGYFKEEGIDLEFIKSQNTADALILLLQGSVDVIDGPLTAGIYNAVKEKEPVRIVAGITQYAEGNGFAGIVVKKTADLPKDRLGMLKYLATRQIAMPVRGSMPNYFIEMLFEKNHFSPEGINFKQAAFPFIVALLGAAGTLDAGFLIEPFVSMARLRNADLEFISLGDDFPDTQASFMFYGANLVEKKRDLGLRFMKAYLKGYRQYAQGKTPRNIEILKKALALDEKLLAGMAWPVVAPDAFLRRKEIVEDFQSWLVKKRFLASAIDVGTIFDTFFLDKAGKE